MTPTIVANWKMQLSVTESVALATAVQQQYARHPLDALLVICPGFLSIPFMRDILRSPNIRLGAQDVFWKDRGAFTGEISPINLHQLGVEYVIVGHSERRALGETNDQIGGKILAALAHSLKPIVCVGESADDRARGQQESVVQHQLQKVFRSAPPPSQGMMIYVAYEPVWAIGTGEAADPEQAEAMRQLIRQTLIDLHPAALVESSYRILYGGSVDPMNVTNYVAPGRYDGALVGGASLEAQSFLKLVAACQAGRTTIH